MIKPQLLSTLVADIGQTRGDIAMRSLLSTAAAAALATFIATPADAAFTISSKGSLDVDGITFGPGLTPTTVNPTGDLETSVTGSISGNRRSPFQDTAENDLPGSDDDLYNAIGLSGSGTTTATFDVAGPLLEIVWGSPDQTGGSGAGKSGDSNRNYIEFFDAGGVFETVTARDVLADQDVIAANTAIDGRGYAWIVIDPGRAFTGFNLVHENANAFEWSGTGVVPLPAAAWMMIGGLGAVYAATRRRRAHATAS